MKTLRNFRLDDDLMAQVQKRANSAHLSLTKYVELVLRDHIAIKAIPTDKTFKIGDTNYMLLNTETNEVIK